MKDQFQVWYYPFADKGPHPVVLISHPDICSKAKYVNVLFCTSQRQSRKPYPWEVMLNSADGLNWESFCDCSTLWVAESSKLANHRGFVTLERRRAIRRQIKDSFLLNATD